MISTGDVISNIHPQSAQLKLSTLNILPAYVTMSIWPINITNTIQRKPALYDSFTFWELVIDSAMSCMRLLSVRKYFALNKFQNCNMTNIEKNTPNS